MGRSRTASRHWENDRAVSELVLQRSRVSAARRARERRLDQAAAAVADALRHVPLTDAEARAAADAVVRNLGPDDG
ncbi:hypothetical protein [Capillimicrobium parvum]|uniref:Uncharacterized protein n=1 Tax=Capillimicrobium parvum TaxID=2884022 RepID=A0A9E6XW30_9ACTN|nr:hypothetical protein [Capillimicrobium parvum]UGS35168.1 hypothetical protein DSM104329_01553 [Capillimicrobium parvum]